jgi:hypothetical protein
MESELLLALEVSRREYEAEHGSPDALTLAYDVLDELSQHLADSLHQLSSLSSTSNRDSPSSTPGSLFSPSSRVSDPYSPGLAPQTQSPPRTADEAGRKHCWAHLRIALDFKSRLLGLVERDRETPPPNTTAAVRRPRLQLRVPGSHEDASNGEGISPLLHVPDELQHIAEADIVQVSRGSSEEN